MISTILFDFGNVLYWFDYGRFFSRVSEFTPHTGEELKEILFGGSDPMAHQFETGRILTSEFISFMLKECKIRMTESDFIQAFVDIFSPNQPVIDLAKKVSVQFPITLISNTNELHYKHFMSLTPIHSYFSEVFLSYGVGVMKPDQKIYRHLLEKLNCLPHECLLIDDLPANIATAKSLGIATIHYKDQNLDLQKEFATFSLVTKI